VYPFRLVILDNLSTLASGIKENDSFEWEHLHNWLLQFRRHKIAVILIHHAGHPVKSVADDKRGARFISRFTKPSRNTQDEIPCFEWHVVTDQVTGEVSVGCKPAQTMDVFLGLIEDGVTERGQIAQEMKTSPATVSRLAKRAIDAGKIIKKSREYFLAEGEKADK
jgi:AAA domain-containing protein